MADMKDKTQAIIDRVKQSGRTYTTSHLTEGGYVSGIGILIGGTMYTLIESDATEADAREFAKLASVDVADI